MCYLHITDIYLTLRKKILTIWYDNDSINLCQSLKDKYCFDYRVVKIRDRKKNVDTRGKRNGAHCFMFQECSVWEDEAILKLDSGKASQQ